MRPHFAVIAAGIAVFLFALPAAIAAHGVDHLDIMVEDLGPGESHAHAVLSLDHGGLRPGWIYLVYGFVQGNETLDVELRQGDDVVAHWTWSPWEFSTGTAKIQREGVHEIVLTNPGDETVRYAFYYDQSCNCEGKVIPLPGGAVLFNNLFPAGHHVQISFPLIENWHLSGALATHDEAIPTAEWPDDFEILAEQEGRGPGLGRGGGGWLNFTFETTQSRMYYVYLQALDGADPDSPVFLGPIFDVEPLAGIADAPGLVAPVIGAAVLALLVALRRRV